MLAVWARSLNVETSCLTILNRNGEKLLGRQKGGFFPGLAMYQWQGKCLKFRRLSGKEIFQGINEFVSQGMATFVAALFKFLKQFFLLLGQVVWRFDDNSRVEISARIVPQLGHTFVTETENLVGLGACRYF